MASGRLADYLGKGDAASRPATLDLHPEAIGFYFSEVTGEWSAWDGAQWLEDIMSGGGGGGITSPTVSRIITSTNPDEPLISGDLLVVLPVPRVIAAAYSPQTYGAGDSVSSVALTTPLDAKEGDMLLLLVASSSPVNTPPGFALVRTQDSPRTVSATGLGRTTVFSKITGPADAGGTVTIEQATSGRMSAVMIVARGQGIEVRSSAGAQYAAVGGGAEFAHTIPGATSDSQGQMAVCAMCCALSNSSGTTTAQWPTFWIPITDTTRGDTPAHERLRAWAAYRYMQNGESTAGACLHNSNSHDGSSVVVTLGCS